MQYCTSCVLSYGNSREDLQVYSSLYLQGLVQLSLVLGVASGPAIGGGLQEVRAYIRIYVCICMRATRGLYVWMSFSVLLIYKAYVLTLYLRGLSCIAINYPRGIFYSHESYGMAVRRS